VLQSLLGSLAIFDIDPGDVPAGNLSLFITQWVITITGTHRQTPGSISKIAREPRRDCNTENVALREEIDSASMFEEIVGTSKR